MKLILKTRKIKARGNVEYEDSVEDTCNIQRVKHWDQSPLETCFVKQQGCHSQLFNGLMQSSSAWTAPLIAISIIKINYIIYSSVYKSLLQIYVWKASLKWLQDSHSEHWKTQKTYAAISKLNKEGELCKCKITYTCFLKSF